ncbi:IQ domain-containing protein M [Manis javanica]|nr:IQ domain-containing protein M [Manis javanica]
MSTEDAVKYSEIIKKSNAIEMLFTLYPPQGAHVRSNVQVRSTWLRPIVNGEEGYKYIVNGHPILKRANIQIVGKLVSKSMRDRKMRQRYYHENKKRTSVFVYSKDINKHISETLCLVPDYCNKAIIKIKMAVKDGSLWREKFSQKDFYINLPCCRILHAVSCTELQKLQNPAGTFVFP